MSSKLTQLPAAPSPDPDDLMYIVRPALGANGSESITNDNLFSIITRNIADRAVRFAGTATIPPLSAAGQGAIYFDQAQNRFLLSESGADYRRLVLAASQIAGANVGAVSPDPTTPANGDLWYNSATNQLMARINGVAVALGVPAPGTLRALIPPITTLIGSIAGQNTLLHQFSVPPNTLRSDGDYFKTIMGGQIAGNNNPKQIRFQIQTGIGFLDEIPLAIIGGGIGSQFGTICGWQMTSIVVRIGATALEHNTNLIMGTLRLDSAGVFSGGGSLVTTRNQQIGNIGGDWGSSTFQFQLHAIASVADDDIVQNLTVVEVCNF